MIRRAVRDERGQTVVLLAISMPLLLALLLLVLDGGRLFVEHQRLLGAARLSAQAGTSALVETTSSGRGTGNALRTDAEVRAITSEAIARNLPGERVLSTIDVDRPARRVSVTLQKPIDAFLGRLTVRISGSFGATAAQEQPASNSGPGSVTTPPPAPEPTASRPQPASTPPTRRCYQVSVNYLNTANLIRTLVDEAPGPIYAALGSTHSWTAVFQGFGSSTFAWGGTFAVPARSYRSGNLEVVSGFGAYPQCP